MNYFDYEFVFEDITDELSSVFLSKPGQVTPVQFVVSIDDSPIRMLKGQPITSICADMLDLAVAVHFADKLALPKKTRQIRVHVSLPLRNPEIFLRYGEELSDLLFLYTRDLWDFDFLPRKAEGRISEQPLAGYLGLSDLPDLTEVALWSGGLDSLAGLQTRLRESSEKHFILVGTGANNIMRKAQQQVFYSSRNHPHTSGRTRFLHIAIKAEYGTRYNQNQMHRARGVVFLLIGAASALASGINKLFVYETGIGSINLPLPGGVGIDHSRAVHPVSLIKVGCFVSKLVDNDFIIENPFVFSTKAEMCCSLIENVLPIFETITCDRLHRERFIQCGFCSSCILRRQALAAAGIEDRTNYLIPHGRMPEIRHQIYWHKMSQQINVIEQAVESNDSWLRLCLEYSGLPEIASCMSEKDMCDEHIIQEKLIRLYRTYVREWRDVADPLFKSITHYTGSLERMEEGKWQQMHLII